MGKQGKKIAQSDLQNAPFISVLSDFIFRVDKLYLFATKTSPRANFWANTGSYHLATPRLVPAPLGTSFLANSHPFFIALPNSHRRGFPLGGIFFCRGTDKPLCYKN